MGLGVPVELFGFFKEKSALGKMTKDGSKNGPKMGLSKYFDKFCH